MLDRILNLLSYKEAELIKEMLKAGLGGEARERLIAFAVGIIGVYRSFCVCSMEELYGRVIKQVCL